MTKRRGHGEGSIYQRKSDGLWGAAVSVPTPDGKRKRVTRWARTQRAAKAKLKALQAEIARGDLTGAKPQKLADHLAWWLQYEVKGKRRPATYIHYEKTVRNHIAPHLGTVRLDKLSRLHVISFVALLQELGTSAYTVRLAVTVLRLALHAAVDLELVRRNVAERITVPGTTTRKARPLTPDEAARFLVAVQGDALEVAYVVAVLCGLRRSELVALRWADVDLERQSIHVEHSKSDAGIRDVPVPPGVVQLLRSHRATLWEQRLRAGGDWQEYDLVVCYADGRPVSGATLYRHFQVLCDQVGIARRPFHSLRHTYGSALGASGAPEAIRQQILGHATSAQTAQYTHAYADALHEAAAAVERLLKETGT